jgi:thymidylate synthase
MELKARNVNDAFTHMVRGIYSGKIPTDRRPSRYGDTLTIPEPVTITYARPRERVLFNPARDCNPFFHVYEALWMLAGRNDVAPVAYYTERMREFSDDGETLNGAYGRRWRNAPASYRITPTVDPPGSFLHERDFVDQLDVLTAHLISVPESRRAVLVMWNVEDDLLKVGGGICPTCRGEWTEEKAKELDEAPPPATCPNCSGDVLRPYLPAPGSKDVCCNLAARFHLRIGEATFKQLEPGLMVSTAAIGEVPRYLDMTVFNRSNDLTWGALGANAVHFSFLLEYMAARVGAEVGVYNQISDDMHVYVAPGRWEPEKWLTDEDPRQRDMWSPPRVSYDGMSLVPLVRDPEAFDREVQKFVEDHSSGAALDRPAGNYTEPFLRDVAEPMCNAFHMYKKEALNAAVFSAKEVRADDWRIAATAWLHRRAERRAKA